jgi:hypothetical protein
MRSKWLTCMLADQRSHILTPKCHCHSPLHCWCSVHPRSSKAETAPTVTLLDVMFVQLCRNNSKLLQRLRIKPWRGRSWPHLQACPAVWSGIGAVLSEREKPLAIEQGRRVHQQNNAPCGGSIHCESFQKRFSYLSVKQVTKSIS